jgi:hypothetical protein
MNIYQETTHYLVFRKKASRTSKNIPPRKPSQHKATRDKNTP